jgi:hypothetical protein
MSGSEVLTPDRTWQVTTLRKRSVATALPAVQAAMSCLNADVSAQHILRQGTGLNYDDVIGVKQPTDWPINQPATDPMTYVCCATSHARACPKTQAVRNVTESTTVVTDGSRTEGLQSFK